MKTLARMTMLAALGIFAVGCSDEAQLRDAQEDFQQERFETAETVWDKTQDGDVTGSDRSAIAEERAQDLEAAGEVVRQQGDLIEDRVD